VAVQYERGQHPLPSPPLLRAEKFLKYSLLLFLQPAGSIAQDADGKVTFCMLIVVYTILKIMMLSTSVMKKSKCRMICQL